MRRIVKSKLKDVKKSKSADVSDLITQKEAAFIRGVTQSAIGDLIKRGRLGTVEMFGRTLVYRSEIETFEKVKPGPKARW